MAGTGSLPTWAREEMTRLAMERDRLRAEVDRLTVADHLTLCPPLAELWRTVMLIGPAAGSEEAAWANLQEFFAAREVIRADPSMPDVPR